MVTWSLGKPRLAIQCTLEASWHQTQRDLIRSSAPSEMILIFCHDGRQNATQDMTHLEPIKILCLKY
ncbi:hypothetical protein BHE74_00041176 [Ensete ventricosum]|nr:hypothetical protein GW17_00002766 [Ensete ventricosum]RWW52406.1 hypothetical protein BHE74_00041176 [Ensete ventricosum]